MTATVRGVSVDGRESSFDNSLQAEYTVVYYVTTDDKNDGPHEVRQATGIPAIGESYSVGNDNDPEAFVVEKRAVQRDSPFEWEVQVLYRSREPGTQPSEYQDPTAEPPEITFGFENRTIVVPGYYQDPLSPDRDVGRQVGIVSSNGELFNPQPEMDVCDPVITVRRKVKDVLAVWMMEVADTVNSVEFYGATPRTFRLRPPTAERKWANGFGFYWDCQFEFVYRWDTWDLQILNRGSFYVGEKSGNYPNGEIIPFVDLHGRSFMGLLRADGRPLNWDNPDKAAWGRKIADGDPETFTRIRIYREIDFNALGIL